MLHTALFILPSGQCAPVSTEARALCPQEGIPDQTNEWNPSFVARSCRALQRNLKCNAMHVDIAQIGRAWGLCLHKHLTYTFMWPGMTETTSVLHQVSALVRERIKVDIERLKLHMCENFTSSPCIARQTHTQTLSSRISEYQMPYYSESDEEFQGVLLSRLCPLVHTVHCHRQRPPLHLPPHFPSLFPSSLLSPVPPTPLTLWQILVFKADKIF